MVARENDCGQNERRKATDGRARRKSRSVDRTLETAAGRSEHLERNRARAMRALRWERVTRADPIPVGGG